MAIHRTRHHLNTRQMLSNKSSISATRSQLTSNTAFSNPVLSSIRERQQGTTISQCNTPLGASKGRRLRNINFATEQTNPLLDGCSLPYPMSAFSSVTHQLSQNHGQGQASIQHFHPKFMQPQNQSNSSEEPIFSTVARSGDRTSSDRSCSSSELDGDEEIIVDDEQEPRSRIDQDINIEPRIGSASCEQSQLNTDKSSSQNGVRHKLPTSFQLQPTTIQAHQFDTRQLSLDSVTNRSDRLLSQRGGQQSAINYLDPTTSRSQQMFSTIKDRSQRLEISSRMGPAFYSPGQDCDQPIRTHLEASEARSIDQLTRLNTVDNLTQIGSLAGLAFIGSNENDSAPLSNLSSDQQLQAGFVSALSDPNTAQALKSQQIRTSIFASFLSRLRGSIDSQTLVTLLLKNSRCLDQKLATTESTTKIKHTETNSLQHSYDTRKVELSCGIGPTLANYNNGAMRSTLVAGDVGLSSSPRLASEQSHQLINFGNSPLNYGPSTEDDHDPQARSNATTFSLISAPSNVACVTLDTSMVKRFDGKPPIRRFNHAGLCSTAPLANASASSAEVSMSRHGYQNLSSSKAYMCSGSPATSIDFKNVNSLIASSNNTHDHQREM